MGKCYCGDVASFEAVLAASRSLPRERQRAGHAKGRTGRPRSSPSGPRSPARSRLRPAARRSESSRKRASGNPRARRSRLPPSKCPPSSGTSSPAAPPATPPTAAAPPIAEPPVQCDPRRKAKRRAEQSAFRGAGHSSRRPAEQQSEPVEPEQLGDPADGEAAQHSAGGAPLPLCRWGWRARPRFRHRPPGRR